MGMEEPPRGGYSGGYGGPSGMGSEPRHYTKPSNGVLILVLGILGIVICGILGPVAWVMGNSSLREIRAGIMDPREEGLVQAGRIIGMIVTGLMALGFLLAIAWVVFVFFVVGVSAAGSR